MDGADVVELCVLLQCVGFTVKSLDTSDVNASQDDGIGKTVVVNCQSSGLHVVMESTNSSCSCPVSKENSGFWQVSGITGGKQLDKASWTANAGLDINKKTRLMSKPRGDYKIIQESGSTLLCTLPKAQREEISNDLLNIVKRFKETKAPEVAPNKSNSMIELKTPEKALCSVKVETPTRYRSLDTLTAGKQPQEIPAPGLLQRHQDPSCEVIDDAKLGMGRRQSTYTVSSTPGSIRRRNKTSSPIQCPQATVLDGLIAAEKTAENLRKDISAIIRQIMDDRCNDSSMSSLALDVSKISILKGIEATKSQFASSPNLSGQDAFKNNGLRRVDSASTSNLGLKPTPNKASKISRLRKISPNIFRSKKDSPSIKKEDTKTQDRTGKFNNLFKAKIVTPVRIPKVTTDVNSNISASKKKFSHVKSTIPRPMPKKE